MRIKIAYLTLAASLLGTIAGCASAPKAGGAAAGNGVDAARAAASPVESRALARWELLIAGKAAEAYAYLSPGYREIKSQEVYAADMANRPVKWTKAEIEGSECPAGAGYCDVTVKVHYQLQSTLPGVGELKSYSPVSERWISSQGSWYFVPKEVARK
jgi:hypothetical protein